MIDDLKGFEPFLNLDHIVTLKDEFLCDVLNLLLFLVNIVGDFEDVWTLLCFFGEGDDVEHVDLLNEVALEVVLVEVIDLQGFVLLQLLLLIRKVVF